MEMSLPLGGATFGPKHVASKMGKKLRLAILAKTGYNFQVLSYFVLQT
jgi:hypothetical protein